MPNGHGTDDTPEHPSLCEIELQIEAMESQWPGEEPNRAAAPSEQPTSQPLAGPSEPGFRSMMLSTALSLAVVLILLGAVRWMLPQMLEWSRYAWMRGQLRAQYEWSGERLQQVSLEGLSSASQWVGQRVSPSVVHIDARRREDFLDHDEPLTRTERWESFRVDQGSGVILDLEGHVVTNFHVVEGSDSVSVQVSDGRVVDAIVIGTDPATDLAVLQIQADHLFPIAWGNSDAMEIGTPVWAVGSPYGLLGTVTFGILSGKHRIDLSSSRTLGSVKGQAEYSDLMQSDVAVNPGNSGGPLVNSKGELVGINTAIIGQSYRGISFSIPSNVVKKVCDRLIQTGKMERGMLGLLVDEAYQPRRTGTGTIGARIRDFVSRDSPAKKAGLLPGDIITKIDGSAVETLGDLRRFVGEALIGQTVHVELDRQGVEMALEVEVAPVPARTR